MAVLPCTEVKALRANEKAVVKSLESADLMKLCGEAVEIGVVPQHVMKSLESMDWDSVTRPRVISASVSPSPVSSHILCLAEGISEDLRIDTQPPRASLAAPSTKVQTCILERHISQLTELLVGCAHRWESISIALGLPEWVRKDLKTRELASGCRACFSECLTRWTVDRYEHARAPTLGNLKEVLRSQSVGLGKEADKLCALRLDQCHADEHPPLSKRPRLETPLLEVLSQSRDTVVSDGKTTLLEVQAVTSQDSSIQYQWFKDDQPFSECQDSILDIHNANSYYNGIYKCMVSIQDGSVSISSRPISLSVCLSPIKKVLVVKYLSEPEVPEDSWPPASHNTYIHLALIKQGAIDKAGEYGRNTVQGNMDDILTDKDSVEYEMVFTDLESAARLLIEGRPGSGKTTLVHKFSQDWARGNPQLNLCNITRLFLVHLRGFFNDQNVKLRDIVQLYYTEESLVDTIVQQAEKGSGEGFCFILDGLDEYRPKPMKGTFIFRLIKRKVLPLAIVIIASRPAASAQFRSTASKQVEVIGFMKEQIYDYIEKYPFPDVEKCSELHKYLEHHPNVHHMCYLPIHAAMVCYLFNIMGSILPRTETEMYKKFTNLTLLRTLKRNQGEVQFKSIEDLPELEKSLLTNICELSFLKTVSSKQVMMRSEVHDFFDQVSSGRESLGLITVDRIAQQYGFEDLYTFLHLTFQEYLAAYHLFQMDKECQLKEFRKHGKKKHMQVVWKFFCGLAQFAKSDTRLVELMKTAGIKEDSLFGVQCAFESQQSVVCDYVVESGEHGTLSFKGHFLTPSDLTAIGYVMKTSTCPVEKLVLDRCKLGREGVDAFLGEAGNKILSVKTLCYHNKACPSEQCQMLRVCLDNMCSIETLDLCGCGLGSRKVHSLTGGGACTLPNLSTLIVQKQHLSYGLLFSSKYFKRLLFNSSKMKRVVFDDNIDVSTLLLMLGFSPLFLNSVSKESCLNLKNCSLRLDNMRMIADYLKLHQLTCLNFANCRIGDDESVALADGLGHCCSLKELIVSSNQISDSGAVRLSDALKYCIQLQSLNLAGNQICDNGAVRLGDALKCCIQLQSLNLGSNLIGATGITAIANSIEHCSNLQRLDISHNDIGDVGAASLAASLKHLSTITVLNLGRTSIGDAGACSLVEAFKSWVKVEELNISYSGIGNTGAKAIGNNISHCTALKKLALNYNRIGDEGAISLSSGLHHLKNMIELNLSYNSIGDEGSEAIARAVAHMKGLKLRIWNHGISERGRSYIASHVKDIDTNFHSLNINNKTEMELKILLHNMQVPSNYVTKERSTSHFSMEHYSYLKSLHITDSFDNTDCMKKAFAKVWQQVSGLQTVELNCRVFGEHSADALTEGLQHNHNLQTLILYDVGTDAGSLAVALGQCKCLHTLELKKCKIYDNGSKAFALSLLNCHNLQTLKLTYCGIGDGTKALSEHLHKCSNLHLSSNEIGDNGAKALAEHLWKCTNLQNLYLGGNEIGDNGAKVLAEHLQKCTNLQKLDLGGNAISADGAKALAEHMWKCTNLQNLKLRGNKIGDNGAKVLAEHLQKCTNLQKLDLGGNKISADGATALAEHLWKCTNLQNLKLHGNKIGDNGAKVLAEHLQKCTNLQKLDLGGNAISADGAKVLAEHLQKCTNLQNLKLRGNKIGDNGAKVLAEHLQKCTKLQKLDLGINEIGDNGAKVLAEHLQKCTNLQNLNLCGGLFGGGNKIGDEGAMALVKCMQKYQIPQNYTDLSGNYKIRNASLCTIIDSKSASVFVKA